MSFAASGAGKFRDPWAIRRCLDSKGTNMAQIARKIGVSPNLVHATVKGVRNNRRVLTALLEVGCSPKILSLPEDMKEKTND